MAQALSRRPTSETHVLCLAGYPLRMSTAVALTASSLLSSLKTTEITWRNCRLPLRNNGWRAYFCG